MKILLVGLGKMGFNLALNMTGKGHEVVAFDISEIRRQEAEKQGIGTASSIEELIKKGSKPRVIWLMIPAGEIVDIALQDVRGFIEPGDIVIDGGNSFYKDSIRRAEELKELGIDYLDAGISGGMEGARDGICAMIGGEESAFRKVEELFKDIAIKNGYMYTGSSGSGHFTKMVHNGIEYGMMQAIGEGFEILEASDFSLDLQGVAELWNHGSVIRGWLMELTARAFSKDPHLEKISGAVGSNGEGLWTAQTALELQIPAPVITTSVITRYRSLQKDTFTGKVVASLRNEFGGHEVKNL